MSFHCPAARQVWVAYCLSAVVSAISLLTRGWITIGQLRQRRRDISEVDAPRPYLQRLNAKIKDGQRTVNMVATHPAHTHADTHPHTLTRTLTHARAHTHTRTRVRTHTHTHTDELP